MLWWWWFIFLACTLFKKKKIVDVVVFFCVSLQPLENEVVPLSHDEKEKKIVQFLRKKNSRRK